MEVIVAMAILTVLAAVGVVAIESASRALSRTMQEARWDLGVLSFDRAIRTAVARLPAPFWAPPPRLLTDTDGYAIVEHADGGQVKIRLWLQKKGSSGGNVGTLLLCSGAFVVAVPGIVSLKAKEVEDEKGRSTGVTITLSGIRRRQTFVVAWNEQRL